MSTATETRYLVRANAEAPEKGPYTLAQIKQSHSKGLLKDAALVRAEHTEAADTRTVKSLVEEGDVARAKMLSAFAEQDAVRAAARERSGGNTNMILGLVLILVGGGLSIASYSAASEGSGGGHYIVFTGIIVVGFFRLIRGATQR